MFGLFLGLQGINEVTFEVSPQRTDRPILTITSAHMGTRHPMEGKTRRPSLGNKQTCFKT
jgi:hypothetical protein